MNRYKMNKALIIIVLSFFVTRAFSQDLSADYYSYYMDMYSVNPAYSGTDSSLAGLLNVRNSVSGIEGAPKNIFAGVHSALSPSQGLGGRLISDSRGAFRMVKGDVAYSYMVSITPDQKLRFGISAGFINKNFIINRVEGYQLLDGTDPTLSRDYYNSTHFIAGAGLLYNWKDLEVSLAAPHAFQAAEAINSFLHSAVKYKIKTKGKFTFQPWVSYQNIPVTENIIGVFTKAEWRNQIWAQAGYQSNNTYNASLGFSLKQISAGYSFQFSNDNLKNICYGNHQIMLAARFASKSKQKSASEDVSAKLDKMINDLKHMLSATEGSFDRAEVMKEIERIKAELVSLENLNLNSDNAAQVEKQLKVISEKLIELENRIKK
jgi:type IX secretion system PorP/SprF family membrane protein